jgi:hypothetical protein
MLAHVGGSPQSGQAAHNGGAFSGYYSEIRTVRIIFIMCRFQVRSSVQILGDTYGDYPQSQQQNVGIILKVGHDRFVPYAFQF